MAAGNHATAFDTNGYLPNLYAKYGYHPIARVAFDPALAPDGWKPEMGKPDVVVLVRDPDGVSMATRIHGDYLEKKDKIPLVSYDKAVEIQKEAVNEVERGQPFGGEESEPDELGLTGQEKQWMREFNQKQAAFERTGKLGLRYDTELTGDRTPLSAITGYMGASARFNRDNLERLNKEGGNSDGWKYGGPADYLEHEGQEFDVPNEPPQIKLGTPKECYSNSANMALGWPSGPRNKYDYAEGLYASPHLPFPIEHAWLVDKKTGTVVDPTLGWQPKARYFGVRYPTTFVKKKLKQQGYYGLHSNGVMANPVVFGVDKDMKYGGKKRST